MLKIPRQQVLERWDVLPNNLKEALCSDPNSGIVWQIGALNHLPEEKISMMATIVGDVIFGFLHSDYLAREIQESLNLNSLEQIIIEPDSVHIYEGLAGVPIREFIKD